MEGGVKKQKVFSLVFSTQGMIEDWIKFFESNSYHFTEEGEAQEKE